MFLKQAAKVLILAGLASVASTLLLSRPAQAECYFFDLFCFGSDSRNATDNNISPDEAPPPRRSVPPMGTTRTDQVTETHRLTRILLTVHSQLSWVDTGIDLSPGDSLSIEAGDTWSASADNSLRVTANGYPNAYNPQALDSTLPLTALIGVIENGEPFFIGESRNISILIGGRLFLSMNDLAGRFDDNSGGMRLEILIRQPL